MSKIGKQPIPLPEGIEVSQQNQQVIVKGGLGSLSLTLPEFLKLQTKNKQLELTCQGSRPERRAKWGLFRSLINNAIIGCSKGFEKKLEIHGVGFTAALENQELVLNLGFSHPVKLSIPQGLKIAIQKNIITVSGIDKQAVGQLAAKIRSIRTPDPYKGKGVRYSDEIVRLKPGKAAKTVGA